MSQIIPTVGRIVHYVLDEGPSKGHHRPAMIVRVWAPTSASSSVQLQVFTDSDGFARTNDQLSPVMWKTSVMLDEADRLPGTWHWPEQVN